MNCERVKEVLADYLVGELAAGLREQVEEHLQECASCREETQSSQAIWEKLSLLPRPEPSRAMDARFERMLACERRKIHAEKEAAPAGGGLGRWLQGWWPRQPALQFGLAMIFFVVGLGVGPAVLRPGTAQPGAGQDPALADLRQEVSGLKRMVTLALLQQPSASERLRGVGWSSRLPAPDEQVLAALLQSLDSDPNVNVRLAAAQALEKFGGSEAVKQGLVASLPRQESPLVQLELIRLLVELREKDSVPVLKALLKNTAVNPTVREGAEWGVEQLGAGRNI